MPASRATADEQGANQRAFETAQAADHDHHEGHDEGVRAHAEHRALAGHDDGAAEAGHARHPSVNAWT